MKHFFSPRGWGPQGRNGPSHVAKNSPLSGPHSPSSLPHRGRDPGKKIREARKGARSGDVFRLVSSNCVQGTYPAKKKEEERGEEKRKNEAKKERKNEAK